MSNDFDLTPLTMGITRLDDGRFLVRDENGMKIFNKVKLEHLGNELISIGSWMVEIANKSQEKTK
jgi:hypothetical protein